MEILKTVVAKMEKAEDDDGVTPFVRFIGSKMKGYTKHTRNKVQHAIFDIITKADNGFYEVPERTVLEQLWRSR